MVDTTRVPSHDALETASQEFYEVCHELLYQLPRNYGELLEHDLIVYLNRHGVSDRRQIAPRQTLTKFLTEERPEIYEMSIPPHVSRPVGKHPLPGRAPELWNESRRAKEQPSQFIKRVYERWLGGGLDICVLNRFDKPLVEALLEDLDMLGKRPLIGDHTLAVVEHDSYLDHRLSDALKSALSSGKSIGRVF